MFINTNTKRTFSHLPAIECKVWITGTEAPTPFVVDFMFENRPDSKWKQIFCVRTYNDALRLTRNVQYNDGRVIRIREWIPGIGFRCRKRIETIPHTRIKVAKTIEPIANPSKNGLVSLQRKHHPFLLEVRDGKNTWHAEGQYKRKQDAQKGAARITDGHTLRISIMEGQGWKEIERIRTQKRTPQIESQASACV